jgi:hypothetical protein
VVCNLGKGCDVWRGRITRVDLMDEEWLIRTAYSAGFYKYLVVDVNTGSTMSMSGNTLDYDTIDQLGSLCDE